MGGSQNTTKAAHHPALIYLLTVNKPARAVFVMGNAGGFVAIDPRMRQLRFCAQNLLANGVDQIAGFKRRRHLMRIKIGLMGL